MQLPRFGLDLRRDGALGDEERILGCTSSVTGKRKSGWKSLMIATECAG